MFSSKNFKEKKKKCLKKKNRAPGVFLVTTQNLSFAFPTNHKHYFLIRGRRGGRKGGKKEAEEGRGREKGCLPPHRCEGDSGEHLDEDVYEHAVHHDAHGAVFIFPTLRDRPEPRRRDVCLLM